MKYDGSAGVRAAYSSTRLRYVRWVAMILVGSTGARYSAPSAAIRAPESSSISPFRSRPPAGAPSATTPTSRSATAGDSIVGSRMTDAADDRRARGLERLKELGGHPGGGDFLALMGAHTGACVC